ncbi:MAG: pilin N-terminal domain-containing protein [Lachnospiraceae bacterium]|nr:pilin N-terminal domain-containing protein [Lachnospiraceae bacterium]
MKVHVKLQTIGILAVLAAVLCFWLAAGSRPALADSGKTGTITVNVEDTDGHAVAGGTLAIYQVAAVQDGKFVYTRDFSSTGKLEKNSDFSDQLADQLASIAEQSKAETMDTRTVDQKGTARFSNLPEGVYLFVQTKEADGYTTLNPFLVTVPFTDTDGVTTYDITANPKPGKVSKKTEPTPAPAPTPTPTPIDHRLPQTGQLWWPVPVLACAGAALLIAGSRKRKNA